MKQVGALLCEGVEALAKACRHVVQAVVGFRHLLLRGGDDLQCQISEVQQRPRFVHISQQEVGLVPYVNGRRSSSKQPDYSQY